MALVVAGGTSAGELTVLVVKKLREGRREEDRVLRA
jgi:uncharacterized protein YoaH (UPF0181 family)